MIKDYQNWINSKQDLIHHFVHHNSIIFNRIEDVFKTINYISKLDSEQYNEDYSIIFDCGYSYLYQVVSEVELILDKYFDNNIHQFLNFEPIINYSLYLNDFKEALIEEEMFNEEIGEEIDSINTIIEKILTEKRMFVNTLLDEFDNRILSVYESRHNVLTTPEVYNKIYEELLIMEGHIDE